jgi:hypothetical protein
LKKDITHRIAYYTSKVAQYGSIHPAKKRPAAHTYRQRRLMAYKKIMFEQISVRYPNLYEKYIEREET